MRGDSACCEVETGAWPCRLLPRVLAPAGAFAVVEAIISFLNSVRVMLSSETSPPLPPRSCQK